MQTTLLARASPVYRLHNTLLEIVAEPLCKEFNLNILKQLSKVAELSYISC